jgi:hypothetical protein
MKRRCFAAARIALLLALAALVPLAAQSESDFDTRPEGGGVVITAYTGPGGAVIIPGTIGGKPVTGIGEAAFYSCSRLASAVTAEGVTSIDSWTFFQCVSLKTVTIPDSVTRVGEKAFGACFSLKPKIRANIEQRFGSRVF